MVMAALARRRELALLRIVGVTRRQIKNMVHAEQAGLLGVALVIGASIAAITLTLVVNALTGDPVPYVPTLGWIAVLAAPRCWPCSPRSCRSGACCEPLPSSTWAARNSSGRTPSASMHKSCPRLPGRTRACSPTGSRVGYRDFRPRGLPSPVGPS
jgi:hypothetical protein